MEQTKTLIQKLKNGEPVRMLIIGDSIGDGCGASGKPSKWFRLLCAMLKQRFGSECSFVDVSLGGNICYAGYVTALEMDDTDFDLVIDIYGANDGVREFALYYEVLLRTLIKKFSRSTIIATIQNAVRKNQSKIDSIREIAGYYSVPVADSLKYFTDSGIDLSVLEPDGCHPSDIGQKLYADSYFDLICKMVECNVGYPTSGLPPLDENVLPFDNFVSFPADKFTRVSDTRFEIACGAVSGMLGLELWHLPGDLSREIFADGVSVLKVDAKWPYNFAQKHIDIALKELSVKESIAIEFVSKELADGFCGIVLSKTKTER